MADGGHVSRCTTATSATAAAAEEDNAVEKKMKTEGPERVVVDGKRLVKNRLPMERVQHILSMDLTPPSLIPTEDVRKRLPLLAASVEERIAGLAVLREIQAATREELRTKGYCEGWLTDEDEDEEEAN